MLQRLIHVVLALAALAMPAMADDISLTGTVTYRERIALPANARLAVSLVDIATGNPVVGAASRITPRAQVPIAFSLNIRSTVARAGGPYGLVAEISSAGRTLFRTPQPVAVDLATADPVDILLQFAPAPEPPQPDPPPMPPVPPALLDTVWTVTSIGGRPVLPERPLTLSIATDMRAGGSGGCNNYFTEASLDGSAVLFGPAAATQMACAPDMTAQEQAYFAALAAVASYQLDGNSLRLLDAAGVPLVGLVRIEE